MLGIGCCVSWVVLLYSVDVKPFYYDIGSDFCFNLSYYSYSGLSSAQTREESDLIEDSSYL